MVRGVVRGADGRIVGRGDGSAGAAVEGFPESQDLGPSGCEGGQFQGILVGFRPAVAQEQPVVFIAADFPEQECEFLLEAVVYGIRIETELAELVFDLPNVMRMAVADADDGVAAIQVRIFVPVFIPEGGVQSADRLDVPPFVYFEQFHIN